MPLVETEKKDQIFIVRINRPERLNALGYEIRTQLAEAWSEFRESKNLEIGIFTGTGRAFCAGEDMKESLLGITAFVSYVVCQLRCFRTRRRNVSWFLISGNP